ncbi:PstS family phosphate ABC transporter substrate-binding protein [Leptolyngbya ohadii]|uniref:PstS family phosphate ABC transporter substrate-binding protein n=1 Tax=Leptolyngbya ohadii TaxID=1962290 RepID=UPI000B59F3D4|nr:PstS family phosphate ABC transporter substrate-binding protein [Leptolyngbya ohadii]
MKAWFGIPSLLAVSTLILSACSTAPRAGIQANTAETQATPRIQIDGSSTVYPLTDAIAKAFQQKQPDASVAVAFSGTTGGFRKFCAGETDINNASRPISTEEIAACREAGVRFVEIPVAFDALTVVVNPQNTWAQSLTVEELKKMWEPAADGKIKTWNQIRPDFPNRPLKLYGAGGQSGTYDYFAEVIAGDRNTRRDYNGSEDDNDTVKAVSSDPDALGYFGFAYFEENQDKLKAVAIDGGTGKGAIVPTREAVEQAQYQPLSRPLFIYINLQKSQEKPELGQFVTFYLDNVEQTAQAVGYIPLPNEAYEISKVHLYKGEVGTAYDGKPQPYLTINEVLQKEQTF